MIALAAVLGLVVVQRLAELRYADRNARALLARGAVEVAPAQHAFFIALHTAWLVAIAAFAPRGVSPVWPLVGAYFVLQLARLWAIVSLGPFWTTRIITLPGAALVRRGPYRWLRHPNYAVVALEIAILPLAFREPAVALAFSALNGALLVWRVGAEERALEQRRRLS